MPRRGPTLEQLRIQGLSRGRLPRGRTITTGPTKTAQQWTEAEEAPAAFFADESEIPQEAKPAFFQDKPPVEAAPPPAEAAPVKPPTTKGGLPIRIGRKLAAQELSGLRKGRGLPKGKILGVSPATDEVLVTDDKAGELKWRRGTKSEIKEHVKTITDGVALRKAAPATVAKAKPSGVSTDVKPVIGKIKATIKTNKQIPATPGAREAWAQRMDIAKKNKLSKDQFTEALKEGTIPEGSVYAGMVEGGFQYLSAAQVTIKSALGSLADYQTGENTYDLAAAINGGVSQKTLLELFSQDTVNTAVSNAAAQASANAVLAKLAPYREGYGPPGHREYTYDLAEAIRNGIPASEIKDAFDSQAVIDAQLLVQFDKYRTEMPEGGYTYDLPQAVKDGLSEKALAVAFGAEAAKQAYKDSHVGLEGMDKFMHFANPIYMPEHLAELTAFEHESVDKLTENPWGRSVLKGLIDVPLMLAALPAVGLAAVGHAGSTQWAKAGNVFYQAGVGIKDYFADLGKRFALAPGPTAVYAIIALGVPLAAPVKGMTLKAVRAGKAAFTKLHPSGIPARAIAIEIDVSRIPWEEAGMKPAMELVGEAIKKQVEASPETLGKVEKIVIDTGTKTLEVKYRRTPMSELTPDTIYHASPDVTLFLNELKSKGNVKVKGELYTSPQAAMDFLRTSAKGIPPANPGIIAIKVGKIGGKDWLLPFKEYRGAIEAEVVAREGLKLTNFKPNAYSKRFGSGLTHEAFTEYKGVTEKIGEAKIRSGQHIPVYWMKSPGAKGVPPSTATLYAATRMALLEALKDIPHTRLRKIKLGLREGYDVGMFRNSREAYSAIKTIAKEIETRAAARVRAAGRTTQERANNLYHNEMRRLALDDIAKHVKDPRVIKELRRRRIDFEKAYEVNLTKYLIIAGTGNRGLLERQGSISSEPVARTTRYERSGRGELRLTKEERAPGERRSRTDESARAEARSTSTKESRASTESRAEESRGSRVAEESRGARESRSAEESRSIRESRSTGESRSSRGSRESVTSESRSTVYTPRGERRDFIPAQTTTPKPGIFPSSKDDDTKKRFGSFKGALTWKMGALGRGKNQKPVYIAIKEPYKSRKDLGYFIGEPPPGARITNSAQTAYETIQQIKGEPPKQLLIDMGIMDIKIVKPSTSPGEQGAIAFVRDVKQTSQGDITIGQNYLRRQPEHTSDISLARGPKDTKEAHVKEPHGPRGESKVKKVKIRERSHASERGKPQKRTTTGLTRRISTVKVEMVDAKKSKGKKIRIKDHKMKTPRATRMSNPLTRKKGSSPSNIVSQGRQGKIYTATERSTGARMLSRRPFKRS